MADAFTASRMAWIESVLLSQSEGLTPFARVVGVTIGQHVNRARGYAHPAVTDLAKMLGASEKGVRGGVQALEKAGLLRVERTCGRSRHNRYFLTGETSDQPLVDWYRARRETSPVGSHIDRPDDEKTSPTGSENLTHRFQKPHPEVRHNPLIKPTEKPASVQSADMAIADRIFAAMPKGSASRSNREKVRTAVAAITAGGVPAVALEMAVNKFMAESPDAAEQQGRFLGAADRWLTEKRGWEAFLPTGDDLFLIGRPESDRQWLWRVRGWQRTPFYWRSKADEFGPPPGEPGCRVPPDILRHVEATQTANDTGRQQCA
ncbi:MAG: helix-turn-helix domain-containing protein [Caulobacteraceae bacterium]|nr:helix-turn-helix domain-containing protein [Caulobacteraceae bacterium]